MFVGLVFVLVLWITVPVIDYDQNQIELKSTVVAKNSPIVAGIPHGPIVIDSDANFSATALDEGWSGDGSSESPFIIDGYDIDLGGAAGTCINITNTRVNFTISNCNLSSANVNPGSGVYLNNVSHGKILGNIFLNDYYAIYLYESNHTTIADNTCDSNTWGIHVNYGQSNTLKNNTCTNHWRGLVVYRSSLNLVVNNNCSHNVASGIAITESTLNEVYNNTCNYEDYNGIDVVLSNSNNLENNTCKNNNEYGIYLEDSDSNTITNNTCSANNLAGIDLRDSDSNTIANNTCNNRDYGINIRYSNSNIIANNTCNYNNDYGIRLYESDFNTIVNNTCNHNNYNSGIYIFGSESNTIADNSFSSNCIYGIFNDGGDLNTITNNTCNYNGQHGIFLLDGANSNTITNNTCSANNLAGIYLHDSDSNTMTNNTCGSNGNYGIYINGLSNDILWNIFANNSVMNGQDGGSGNFFDYNYWSDYSGIDANQDGFGDTPYVFTGNSDPHPLMYLPVPPRWIDDLLVDEIIEFGSPFLYDFNATGDGPLFWSVNDAQFSINSEGLLSGFIAIGDYGIDITVSNIYGISVSTTFHLAVVPDAGIPPQWLIIPTNQTLAFNEKLDCQVAAIDSSGIHHWELNNTLDFVISISFYADGSTARITNSSFLNPRLYNLNITVYDVYGNKLSAIFTVTVNPPEQDTVPPAWITLHISQTIEHGQALEIYIEAWDASGIDHFWLNDTDHFTLDEQGVIRNATILEPGVYRLEVRAYDPYDNYCIATLVVTVLEAPTTPTTTTTTTTTTQTGTTSPTTPIGPGGMDPLVTLVIGVSFGGAMVIVIVIVLHMKRRSASKSS